MSSFSIAQPFPVLGQLISPDEIDVPFGNSGRWPLGDLDGSLVLGHETNIHHEPIQLLQPFIAEDAREDGSTVQLLEGPSEIRKEEAHP